MSSFFWDRSRIPRDEPEPEPEPEFEEDGAQDADAPEAPKWFARVLASAEVGAEPAPAPEKKGWDFMRLAALAMAGGGLYWVMTYDPLERFPSDTHPKIPSWFDEVDRLAGPSEDARKRIIGATSAGVILPNQSLPLASRGSYGGGGGGYSRGGGSFDDLDDMDDLGGDGGDLIEGGGF